MGHDTTTEDGRAKLDNDMAEAIAGRREPAAPRHLAAELGISARLAAKVCRRLVRAKRARLARGQPKNRPLYLAPKTRGA
jgi:hypothetical protein